MWSLRISGWRFWFKNNKNLFFWNMLNCCIEKKKFKVAITKILVLYKEELMQVKVFPYKRKKKLSKYIRMQNCGNW